MATEAEIRTRAMQEFQMAVEIGQIRRNGIMEARAEALNAVPAGQAALQVYSEALQPPRRPPARRNTRSLSRPVRWRRSTPTPSTATPTWR